MIPAEKRPFPLWLVHTYVRRRLRKMFHAVELTGELEPLRQPDCYPLLLFSNHTSWWDGFLKVPFFDAFQQEYFVMMEEKNLQRFPLFRKVGVFGVDLDSPDGRRGSLLYAARLLRQAAPGQRRVLLIYPHGRLVPQHEPLPEFQEGVEGLARLCPRGHAVPLGLSIRFDKFPDPIARLHLGAPIPFSIKPDRGLLERSLKHAVEASREPPDGPPLYLIPPKRHYHGKTD